MTSPISRRCALSLAGAAALAPDFAFAREPPAGPPLADIPQIPGPSRTIAVSADVEEALGARLAAALRDSGRFIVVGQAIGRSAARPSHRLWPAQYLVTRQTGLTGPAGELRLIETRTGATIETLPPPALSDAGANAIGDTVTRIALALAARPWKAQVLEAEDDVVIGAGQRSGLRAGDRMSVHRVVETLTDPASGALLGENAMDLGVVTLTGVGMRLARGSFQPRLGLPAMTGDFLLPHG